MTPVVKEATRMRAETESLASEVQQSLVLLRRHL